MYGLSPQDRIISVEGLLRAMLWLVIVTSGLTTMLFTAFLLR